MRLGDRRVDGNKKSKVGIGGESAGGTISSSVAHDVPGLSLIHISEPTRPY